VRLDAFLKFNPAVAGESTDNIHPAEIEILSFQHRIFREGKYQADGNAPRPSHGSLRLVKAIDEASPQLYDAMPTPKLFTTATLVVRGQYFDDTANKNKYGPLYNVELSNAYLTRIHLVSNPRLYLLSGDQVGTTGMAEIADNSAAVHGHWFNLPMLADDIAAVGMLEEIDLVYEKITWWYQKAATKTGWDRSRNAPTA